MPTGFKYDRRSTEVYLADEEFTLLLVPAHAAPVRKYRIRARTIRRGAVAAGCLALVLAAFVVHYATVASDARQFSATRDENVQLKDDLEAIRAELARVSVGIERVGRFNQRLRELVTNSQELRALPIGPTQPPQLDEQALVPRNPFTDSRTPATRAGLEQTMARVSGEAARQVRNLQELQAYFQEQKSMLASAPSVWPVRGWVSSEFGVRTDPYTAGQVMHTGIDISGVPGKAILAPADGLVVFAGTEDSFGNVLVIDHGFGIKTRYGHLLKVTVKVGSQVQRGMAIAELGNTGRTTGPHLHYEVRVNGIAQNPRKFFLSDY